MHKYLKYSFFVVVLVTSMFASRAAYGQGLALDDNENWDKFKPSAAIFIQPLNVFGYYPRLHLGMSVMTKNGLNFSLMTAVKFMGFPRSASDFTVLEFRPEISYFLLSPYNKVNLRVGLEGLFTAITEKRHDGHYYNNVGDEINYSVATVNEQRRGLRLVFTMVLATNKRFVFEPYLGIGLGRRLIQYTDVTVLAQPPHISISQGLYDLIHINVLDSEDKLYEGDAYYFLPTLGIKLGFRILD